MEPVHSFWKFILNHLVKISTSTAQFHGKLRKVKYLPEGKMSRGVCSLAIIFPQVETASRLCQQSFHAQFLLIEEISFTLLLCNVGV